MIVRTLRVRADAAEEVRTRLVDAAPGGWEEREEGGRVDFLFYGNGPVAPDAEDLAAAAGPALLGVDEAEVADDWDQRWRQWHRAVRVEAGSRVLCVRPPWEPAPGEGIDVVIDPAQAFGTGAHDTTRLCLEALCELEPGGSLADWGCGSGVLAIAAAKLGFAPVTAVDHDPLSVQATRANAVSNDVPGVEVGQVDLTREAGPSARVVVANLLQPLLLEIAARLAQAPEVLIVSGLLRHQGDEVAAAFAAHGLAEARRREAGEWCALELRREAGLGR